jgi:hypothetical protein
VTVAGGDTVVIAATGAVVTVAGDPAVVTSGTGDAGP